MLGSVESLTTDNALGIQERTLPEHQIFRVRRVRNRVIFALGLLFLAGVLTIAVIEVLSDKAVGVVITELTATENGFIEFRCEGEHFAPSIVRLVGPSFGSGTVRTTHTSASTIRSWSKLLGIRNRFEFGRSFQLPESSSVELCVATGDKLKLRVHDEIVIATCKKTEGRDIKGMPAGELTLRLRVDEFR
jgi:hypothetical protein